MTEDKLFIVDVETLEFLLYGTSKEIAFKVLEDAVKELKGKKYTPAYPYVENLVFKRFQQPRIKPLTLRNDNPKRFA